MSTEILVVDDNHALAENLAEILEDEGHRVIVANDARGALDLAAAHRFGAVLLDIRMPGMDGVALGAELLARDPSVRCALMTAYTADARVAEARALGLTLVLPKPVPLEELLAWVARVEEAE